MPDLEEHWAPAGYPAHLVRQALITACIADTRQEFCMLTAFLRALRKKK